MYILTTEKFESFFRLEVYVIHVIRFPHLSRFESDGASANLLFSPPPPSIFKQPQKHPLKYAIAYSPPATYRLINNSGNSFSGL